MSAFSHQTAVDALLEAISGRAFYCRVEQASEADVPDALPDVEAPRGVLEEEITEDDLETDREELAAKMNVFANHAAAMSRGN